VDDPIVKTIHIDAPPEVVFEFLTNPAKLTRWLGLRAELEPRPGGIFRVDPNTRDVIRGTYLEVVPPSRVVFTWGWEEPGREVPAGSSTVEIELEREGKGTRLQLTHRNLPPPSREGHEKGWTHYLDRLKTVSEGGNPGADPLADPAMRHGSKNIPS
jgi:uncharacterized protein YndB with AHSA1/START domain